MSKILAFSGSNSSTSINQSLVRYAADITDAEVIDLRDYTIPMFSEDLEKSEGIPSDIQDLQKRMMNAAGIIMATPEHNGHFPAFFKNILDWLSRTGVKYMETKSVLVLSTSNGRGGAAKAAAALANPIKYAGGELIDTFSLPGYSQNFDQNAEKISNNEFDGIFKSTLARFEASINK